ncbi:hypothetical protein FHS42_006130 [Streptomyces zagrosensis]|uniref:Uncharacterized protein n=1 Tax=Streptomyces zagrosensis TaxID=1042984 RepID=A0A7W9QEY9_9ACTN|nr:hypothetical protein [Streptomyces zagrosensis]
MRGSADRRSHPPETTAIAAEAEGFLIAHRHRARRRTAKHRRCTKKPPWLTIAQAEDLTHHYVNHRVALTRQLLTATSR